MPATASESGWDDPGHCESDESSQTHGRPDRAVALRFARQLGGHDGNATVLARIHEPHGCQQNVSKRALPRHCADHDGGRLAVVRTAAPDCRSYLVRAAAWPVAPSSSAIGACPGPSHLSADSMYDEDIANFRMTVSDRSTRYPSTRGSQLHNATER
jgi:hypothetical protein